jgi:hypothetical protein
LRGTFDKQYDEITGRLFFKDTHVVEMLRLGRSRVEVAVETLMMIDSLDMNDQDCARIAREVRGCPESRVVITHGTDTMVETAAALAREVRDKTSVLTGAMVPYAFGSSGRPVQPGERPLVCPGLAGGGVRGDERHGSSLESGQKEPAKRGVRGRRLKSHDRTFRGQPIAGLLASNQRD